MRLCREIAPDLEYEMSSRYDDFSSKDMVKVHIDGRTRKEKDPRTRFRSAVGTEKD
jgi:hypothetical protein